MSSFDCQFIKKIFATRKPIFPLCTVIFVFKFSSTSSERIVMSGLLAPSTACTFIVAISGVLATGPSYGSMLGGTVMTVSGPCFVDISDSSNIKCKFGDVVTQADIIDTTRAQCILPMLLKTGRIPVAISTDNGQNYNHSGIVTLGKSLKV